MEIDYFSVYEDALRHLYQLKNGTLKRGHNPDGLDCYVWKGVYTSHFLYGFLKRRIRSDKLFLMKSKEDELRILNKIDINKLFSINRTNDFEWAFCYFANEKGIKRVKLHLENLNALHLFGEYDWRIPTFKEIQLLDFESGIYWCTDDNKECSANNSLAECGIAYDFESQYFHGIRYHDSKHINGTCRFEGGGYNYEPSLVLIR